MRKKRFMLMATAIMATVTMNVRAQEIPVLDETVTKDAKANYWSRGGDAVANSNGDNILGTTNTYPVRIRTDNKDRVFIATDGKVGINTINPLQRLHILDGNILISRSVSDELGSTNGTIYFGDVVDPLQPFGKWGIEYVSSTEEGYGLNFWMPWVDGQQHPDNFLLFLADDGNVGVGTNKPRAKLAVNGGVLAKSMMISISSDYWPDYVFGEDYELMPLRDLEAYVKAHKHLPGVPSAADVDERGDIDLGEMNTLLLEKVEELTRYVIDLQKQIDEIMK